MLEKYADSYQNDYQVLYSDCGNRVWVNAIDGSCVARYNKRTGIDIHTTATQQLKGESECMYCTHTHATVEDWRVFCAKINTLFGIEIDKEFMRYDE